jgi:hypothetical protein
MADGQRAGGVGADTFDLGAFARADIQREHVFPGSDNRFDQLLDPGFGQLDIQKAGSRDLQCVHVIRRIEMPGNRLGNLARFAAGGFGELHGDRAGVIALLRFAAALDRHLFGNIKRGQITGSLGSLDRGPESGGELNG